MVRVARLGSYLHHAGPGAAYCNSDDETRRVGRTRSRGFKLAWCSGSDATAARSVGAADARDHAT